MRNPHNLIKLPVLLLGLWVAGWNYGAAQAPQSAAPPPGPSASGVAGAEVCATCHADITKNFEGNPHTRLALMHGGKGVTCESCHGPAQAHVDSGGDINKIFSFKKATPKEVEEKCDGCHSAKHPNFAHTAHGEAGVSCISCHSLHNAGAQESLLKAKQVTLCTSCHTDVKPQFSQAFHHKVNEGLMQCSDCHDPHGTFERKNLKTTAEQNQVCMKCHSDTAGPFVYEHPPVKTEGCVSCHSPHGSQNPRMLVRSNVNQLCMQCHTQASNFSAPGTPSFHNQANQYQACTVCHTQVHGSNASSVFFK